MPEILSIGELLDLGNSAATAGLIPYSALEYNGSGDISGISGSAIAGGVDSAVVSSIVSSYVSSKVDQSAFDDCCSSMSSVVSSKLDASASSLFQPSGDYYSASNPSGFITGVDLSEYQEKSGMTAYQPVGDYYSASNPSGFITGVDLSEYAKESSLSSKLDASASSQFQPSGDYVYNSSMSSYVPFSGLEYSAGTQTITAISGSAIGGQGVSIASSYLYVDSGLELIIDGESAILRTSGLEPAIEYGYSDNIITSINGSSISANVWDVVKETAGLLATATLQSLDIVYTPSPDYRAYGSGSASSQNTATSMMNGYPNIYYVEGIEPSLPIPTPSNRMSSVGETAYASYYFDVTDATAYSGEFNLNEYYPSQLQNSGVYEQGTPLSTYTGDGYRRVIFFKTQYGFAAPTTFEGTAFNKISARFIQVTKEDACLVRNPIGWLSSNSTAMSVGPTKAYDGYVSSFSSFNGYYNSSTYSANWRIYLSACSGWGPYSIHFAADVTDIPGDTNWYLVQKSPVNGNEIIDMCKTYGSSGSVRLDGVTLGRANGDYCSGVYVSSVTNGYGGDSGNMVANSMICRGYQIPTGTVLTNYTSESYSN